MRTIESDTQQGCVKWFRLAYPKLSKLLFSVPNGGYRNIGTAKRMVAEGVVAGVSDLILFYPSKGKHALCIEMKTKQGKQSEKQKQWQIAVENFGYKYIICHSFDEFKAEIQKYIN